METIGKMWQTWTFQVFVGVVLFLILYLFDVNFLNG